MSEQFYNKELLRFILFDVLDSESLMNLPKFEAHDKESILFMLDAAHQLAEQKLFPIHLEMDKDEPQFDGQTIKVHKDVRSIMKEFGDQGWISCTASFDEGGQQLPFLFYNAASFIFGAANYSATVFPFLGMGSSELIRMFGNKELKDLYVPKIFSGEWQGTMALTEPDAGSSLSDITTKAEKQAEGHYLIQGQKVFISGGDHDACDNVVHLMLAKIPGGPLGVKGISLFVVPKYRVEGDQLVANDVKTAGIFHKMGYKGAPIVHLITGESGDCHGYLVGEEHQGLKYMFRMMNGARIGVGLHAVSIASAAYYCGLNYSKERLQGRVISEKDPATPQVPLIKHADVKRMLLFQKSMIEGALGLLMECALYEDLASHAEDEKDRQRYQMMLDFLTPIAKSFPSETGIISTSYAMQIHGGYGYTTEYAAEKYFREIRIHAIHEGATAIHGLDLLGRKMVMKNGQASMAVLTQISKDIAEAKKMDSCKEQAEQLEKVLAEVQMVSINLMQVAQQEGIAEFLADATLFLELFGLIACGWQLLKQQAKTETLLQENSSDYSDEFLKSKQPTLDYFMEYEMVKCQGLITRLKSKRRITTSISEDLLI